MKLDLDELERVAKEYKSVPHVLCVACIEEETGKSCDCLACQWDTLARPATVLALIERQRKLEAVAEAAKALKNGNSICTCERSGICEHCALHEALAALGDE